MGRRRDILRSTQSYYIHEVRPISASSSSVRSYGTRYLTKIADQILVLLSEEYASAIVWSEEETIETLDLIEGAVDRMFTFEVAKTKEEKENVTPRPGFEVCRLHTLLLVAD